MKCDDGKSVMRACSGGRTRTRTRVRTLHRVWCTICRRRWPEKPDLLVWGARSWGIGKQLLVRHAARFASQEEGEAIVIEDVKDALLHWEVLAKKYDLVDTTPNIGLISAYSDTWFARIEENRRRGNAALVDCSPVEAVYLAACAEKFPHVPELAEPLDRQGEKALQRLVKEYGEDQVLKTIREIIQTWEHSKAKYNIIAQFPTMGVIAGFAASLIPRALDALYEREVGDAPYVDDDDLDEILKCPAAPRTRLRSAGHGAPVASAWDIGGEDGGGE
ncbi:MAG: hypothetical protein PHU25_09835 [Deltaproteobacteria bacterium]|nr:hypothetical protein [Deltaproteobacteria bacterium]